LTSYNGPTNMKSFLVALVGIFSFIYLLNPTFGVLEFLPDNIPLVGNVDDATATMALLGALRYFGWDLTNLFHKRTALDFGTQQH
jgi:hypothetical protein